MAERIQETPIRSFGPVSVLTDSTETAPKLTLAKNVRLRPIGSICGPPLFDRLAQIGNSQFVDDIFFGLTYTPFGGSPRALVRATDKTIAIDVSSQGEHWLVFYSLNSKKNRGLHYMGNDGTFHGVANFVTGTATMQVLAVGLNDNARWYSSLNYGALHLGNGVDANAIVQLSRTSQSPGKWRLAGSNQRPAAAVLRQIVPTSTNAVTASWTIPGTNGAQFNANSAAGGIYFSPSADGSTNVFTDPTGPHGLLADDQIIFDGTPPSGITVDVAYFVLASGLTANSFKVSATSGGSPIDIGSVAVSSCFVTLVSKVWAPNHAFSVGDIVNVASTVALPSELTTAAYYVVTATADEVGHRWGRALVRHVRDVDAHRHIGNDTTEMRGGPGARDRPVADQDADREGRAARAAERHHGWLGIRRADRPGRVRGRADRSRAWPRRRAVRGGHRDVVGPADPGRADQGHQRGHRHPGVLGRRAQRAARAGHRAQRQRPDGQRR